MVMILFGHLVLFDSDVDCVGDFDFLRHMMMVLGIMRRMIRAMKDVVIAMGIIMLGQMRW